ncbi:MAG TPA: histidine kinase, partial [Solirubrobacteraceae bacterium]|nr:histidine kinase [Solirubrobacteraceae bacterium]
MSILRAARHSKSMMSSSDQLKLPAVRDAESEAPSTPRAELPNVPRRAVPMLWRVFAANAAVFALAFALLALAPVTLHASIRVEEIVLLLVGLVVMLVVDLLLVRQALGPLARLANVMRSVDLLQPGRRAVGFDRSSTEVLALADAFNEMLQRLEDERRDSSARVLAAQEDERLRIARELHDEIGQTLTAVALRAEHAAGKGGPERRDLAELAEVV